MRGMKTSRNARFIGCSAEVRSDEHGNEVATVNVKLLVTDPGADKGRAIMANVSADDLRSWCARFLAAGVQADGELARRQAWATEERQAPEWGNLEDIR